MGSDKILNPMVVKVSLLFQAIDLIDEAGSRVRLRHAQLPEEARDLDKELRALLKEKDAAVRGQVWGFSVIVNERRVGVSICG